MSAPAAPRLVECVPNFSEGRDPAVVHAIRDAIAAVPGAAVLDVTMDASHHRSVITFVATLDAAVPAALAAIRAAAERIDLTRHAGVHPRVGAADVVPFVPLADHGTTMDDCVALARALGARVGEELGIPVYLYERAATRPDRVNLADVRRGGFEALREQLGRDAARAPDFGPAAVHPTAGATVIGARDFLVAYNVFLGPAEHLPVARAVARAVRASSGGLAHVKALGLEVDGQAQVSMNLVDHVRTPLHVVYDAVRDAARAHGVEPTWSELIGLVPERALLEAGAHHVGLRDYAPSMVLEGRLRAALAAGALRPGTDDVHPTAAPDAFADRVAAPTPTPGGGSVAAHVGMLAAALARMVATITASRPRFAERAAEFAAHAERAAALRATLDALEPRDAAAYEALIAARRLPRATDDDRAGREAAVAAALAEAARVPLETAAAAADVAELAATLARDGIPAAASDCCAAALFAEAACRAAALNVRVNAAELADPARARALRAAAATHERRAAAAVRAALASAEPSEPSAPA